MPTVDNACPMKFKTVCGSVSRIYQLFDIDNPIVFDTYCIEIVLVRRPNRRFSSVQGAIRKDHYGVVADERLNRIPILSAKGELMISYKGLGGHNRFQFLLD